MTRAAGARSAVVRLMAALVIRNPTALITRRVHAADFRTSRCRLAVRGFFWSNDQSLRRLKSMAAVRSEEHTSELQSHVNLVCRLLLEKKKKKKKKQKKKKNNNIKKIIPHTHKI